MFKILLVDDDKDDYVLLHDCLEVALDQRFKLTWLKTRKDGFEAAMAQDFDVCFIDHVLGGELGLNLIGDIYEKKNDLLLIMISGSADNELDLKALAAGATDFIPKPELSPSLLSRVLRHSMYRKNKEHQLKQVRQATERSQVALQRLIANVTHEIRAPIISIAGLAQKLLDLDIAPDANLLGQDIYATTQASLELINDLLNFSKNQSSSFRLNKQVFNLKSVLDETLAIVAPTAEAKEIDLEVDDQLQNTILESDPIRLRQVFLNLIGNAIKFTKQGKVTLRRIHSDEDPSILKVEIQDTGIGIPPEKQRVIFDAFRQADESIHQRFGGTGLGLSISKQIVEAMGGTISVESSVGEGSCFTLALPIIAGTDSQSDAAPSRVSQLKVLVADDDNGSRFLLCRLLKKLGIEPLEANNGRAALEQAIQQNLDLIFTDINMPELDGIEVAETLSRCLPKEAMPTIVGQTAHLDAAIRQECLRAGMRLVLTKPIKIADLKEIIYATATA